MKYTRFRCGRVGHLAKDCHQKDKTCYKCGRVGYFAGVCKIKMAYDTDKRSSKMVKQVNSVDFDQNNNDCMFTVHMNK